MKIETTKTTTSTISVNISTSLLDDSGTKIAVMVGNVDKSRPLGSTNLLVYNQNLFNQYKDSIKEQYKAFQESVAEISAGTTVSEETESEDLADDND